MKRSLFKSQQEEPASRRWRKDRQAILEFNRSLALIVDSDALMSSVVARLRELFGTDRVIILRAVSEGGMFSAAFSVGYSADELKSLHPAFENDFYAAVKLQAVLDCHDVIGGTARERVKGALADAKERITKIRGGAAYART